MIVLRNTRWIKKTDPGTTESHYYLSSALPQQYRPAQWMALIRGHWAGVEVRNHWQCDVLFGEDGSRSRNPILLANRALIPQRPLGHSGRAFPQTPGPVISEQLSRNPSQSLRSPGA